MYCPVCKTINLVMSERQGIEIDYCPQCRGVWLDRGELDKIIEKSLSMSPSPRMETQAPSYSDQRPADRGYPEPHQGQYYKKKKREGFLSNLFDFD